MRLINLCSEIEVLIHYVSLLILFDSICFSSLFENILHSAKQNEQASEAELKAGHMTLLFFLFFFFSFFFVKVPFVA